MQFQFTDAVALDGRPRVTRDGYMVCDARIARAGNTQTYRGIELDRPDLDTVAVYRPEEAVFDTKAMASFTTRPITVGHPKSMVTAANWKDVSVGTTGETIARDGDHIRVPLLLLDKFAIEAVQSGARELSCGYTCDIEWRDGETPSGEKFQAVMNNIKGNHLALVDRARAGPTCRIGDEWTTPSLSTFTPTSKEPDNMAEATLRTALVDGLEIQTTHQGAQAIEKLQRQLSDGVSQIALKDAEIASIRADHSKAISAKDGEIAALVSNYRSELEAKDGERAALVATHTAALEAKDGEIAALKVQIPDAATLDARAAERTRVIDAATKLAGKFDPTGKPDTEIKRLAVGKKLGDAHVTGKSDEYISAAFETLALTAASAPAVDPVRNAIKAGVSQVGDGQADPKAKWLEHLNNAWKKGNEPVAAA